EATGGTAIKTAPPKQAGYAETLAWIGPFAAFLGVMVIEKLLPIPSGWLYPLRAAVTQAVLLLVSRQVIPWVPSMPLASIGIGVAVFVIWIGPDVLWPGFRKHWLFSNSLLGAPN